MLGNQTVDDCPAGFECPDRLVFVLFNFRAVADHIRGKDYRNFAFNFFLNNEPESLQVG